MQTYSTLDRIELAAIELFLKQGVKRTSLADVAFQAGVTRITVYRYYDDRKGLVRAVCMRIADIFRRAAEPDSAESLENIDDRLNRLGTELRALPQGNLLARLEEISRLYPDVYEEFRNQRQAAVDGIFRLALAAAKNAGTVREGLHPEVLKVIFFNSVLSLLENPELISSNVPLAEIFSTVTAVFRYGILKASNEVSQIL
jgi:AcrR family transcriptional regulator